MYPIRGQRLWPHSRGDLGQRTISGDIFGTEVCRQAPYHLDARVQILPPGPLLRADRQQERLDENHPPDARALCPGEYVPVGLLVGLDRRRIISVVAAPGVVDADHHRQHIGGVLQHVPLPPQLQVCDPIAADSGVDDLLAGQLLGDKRHVSVAEAGVVLAVPVRVGDRITGEDKSHGTDGNQPGPRGSVPAPAAMTPDTFFVFCAGVRETVVRAAIERARHRGHGCGRAAEWTTASAVPTDPWRVFMTTAPVRPSDRRGSVPRNSRSQNLAARDSRPQDPAPRNSRARSAAPQNRAPRPETAPAFADLGVPTALVRALAKQGLDTAFPIQAATLGDTLNGRDVLGRGRTGSGKTLAFSIPMAANLTGRHARPNQPLGLILAPTRELASQIGAALTPLAEAAGLRTTVIFGGVSQQRQVAALDAGVEILIACPGRLEDLRGQGHLRLDAVEITVLDEADHMADLGFLPAVRRILDQTPPTGQRMLFSATLDRGVDVLVKRYLHEPLQHSVDVAESPVTAMTHHIFDLPDVSAKKELVRRLAAGQGRRLLFTRTKHQAKKLAR